MYRSLNGGVLSHNQGQGALAENSVIKSVWPKKGLKSEAGVA